VEILKCIVAEFLESCLGINPVLVVKRIHSAIQMKVVHDH
jgi:acetyl-CoA synthetase